MRLAVTGIVIRIKRVVVVAEASPLSQMEDFCQTKTDGRSFGIFFIGAEQKEHPRKFAKDNSHHGSRRRVFHSQGKQMAGQQQNGEDANDLFDDLGNSVRTHMLPPLKVSPEDRGDRHDRDDRSNAHQGIDCPSIGQEGVGDHRCGQQNEDGEKNAGAGDKQNGDHQDGADPLFIFLCLCFGNQFGNGHRDAAGGDHNDEQQDGKGHLKQADPFVPDHAGQGDSIDKSQDLGDKTGTDQDEGSM